MKDNPATNNTSSNTSNEKQINALTPEQDQLLDELIQSNLPGTVIAQQVGCHKSTVSRRRRKLRKESEALASISSVASGETSREQEMIDRLWAVCNQIVDSFTGEELLKLPAVRRATVLGISLDKIEVLEARRDDRRQGKADGRGHVNIFLQAGMGASVASEGHNGAPIQIAEVVTDDDDEG